MRATQERIVGLRTPILGWASSIRVDRMKNLNRQDAKDAEFGKEVREGPRSIPDFSPILLFRSSACALDPRRLGRSILRFLTRSFPGRQALPERSAVPAHLADQAAGPGPRRGGRRWRIRAFRSARWQRRSGRAGRLDDPERRRARRRRRRSRRSSAAERPSKRLDPGADGRLCGPSAVRPVVGRLPLAASVGASRRGVTTTRAGGTSRPGWSVYHLIHSLTKATSASCDSARRRRQDQEVRLAASVDGVSRVERLRADSLPARQACSSRPRRASRP